MRIVADQVQFVVRSSSRPLDTAGLRIIRPRRSSPTRAPDRPRPHGRTGSGHRRDEGGGGRGTGSARRRASGDHLRPSRNRCGRTETRTGVPAPSSRSVTSERPRLFVDPVRRQVGDAVRCGRSVESTGSPPAPRRASADVRHRLSKRAADRRIPRDTRLNCGNTVSNVEHMLRAAVAVATTVVLLARRLPTLPPPPTTTARTRSSSTHPARWAGRRSERRSRADPSLGPVPVDCLVPDPGCARWTDRPPPTGRHGDLDGILAVYESTVAVAPVTCAPTDRRGRRSSFSPARKARLLHPLRAPPQLRRRHLHDEGRTPSRPQSRRASATARREACAVRSIRSSSRTKAWSTRMQAGTTYKLNLVPSGSNASYSLFFSGTSSFRGAERCCGASAADTRRSLLARSRAASTASSCNRAVPSRSAALPPPGRPRGA